VLEMELNKENYENYLLLYVDNELTASQKAAVEAFLITNPKYAAELSALQAVQLNPDTLQFTDKSSLYRFDEMNAILDPNFKKTLYKKNTSSARIIGIKKTYIAYASIAAAMLWLVIGSKQLIQQPITQATANTSTTTITPKAKDFALNAVVTAKPVEKQMIDNSLVNNEPIKVQETIASNSIGEPVKLTEQQTIIVNHAEAVDISANTASSPVINSSLAAEVKQEKESFEEINTEDNDRVIYISNIELDGDKFRGITRRLGVFFKRNKIDKNK
jgi:hypothetical protein